MPNANFVNTPVENWGKRRWRRQTHPFGHQRRWRGRDTFCERVLKAIKTLQKTLKEDASFCQVSMISATSLDNDLNLYWDVSGGVEERQDEPNSSSKSRTSPKTSALSSMTVVCVNSADSKLWHASLMNKMRPVPHRPNRA